MGGVIGIFNGIYFFTSIFTGIIGLTLFNTLVKRKHDITLSFIFTLVVMIITSSSFTARAQLISYPIFILEIYLIEKVIKEGKRREN